MLKFCLLLQGLKTGIWDYAYGALLYHDIITNILEAWLFTEMNKVLNAIIELKSYSYINNLQFVNLVLYYRLSLYFNYV